MAAAAMGDAKAVAAPAAAPLTCTSFTYGDNKSIAEDLMCAINLNPMYDPVTHTACGNTYCRACLAPLKNCPHCNADMKASDVVTASLIVRNMLSAVVVVCTDCRIELKRDLLAHHKSHDCAHAVVSCRGADAGCVWRGARSEAKAHEATCVALGNGAAAAAAAGGGGSNSVIREMAKQIAAQAQQIAGLTKTVNEQQHQINSILATLSSLGAGAGAAAGGSGADNKSRDQPQRQPRAEHRHSRGGGGLDVRWANDAIDNAYGRHAAAAAAVAAVAAPVAYPPQSAFSNLVAGNSAAALAAVAAPNAAGGGGGGSGHRHPRGEYRDRSERFGERAERGGRGGRGGGRGGRGGGGNGAAAAGSGSGSGSASPSPSPSIEANSGRCESCGAWAAPDSTRCLACLHAAAVGVISRGGGSDHRGGGRGSGRGGRGRDGGGGGRGRGRGGDGSDNGSGSGLRSWGGARNES